MKRKINTIVMSVFLFVMACAMQVMAKEGAEIKGVVNVNTASIEQLMVLPGIGEKKAALIIEARKNKPFAKPEDLLEVKGIGEKMLEKIKPYVTFQGETTVAVQ